MLSWIVNRLLSWGIFTVEAALRCLVDCLLLLGFLLMAEGTFLLNLLKFPDIWEIRANWDGGAKLSLCFDFRFGLLVSLLLEDASGF